MKKKSGFSYAKYGYLFSLPFIIVFAFFTLYPTINTALLGFTDCQGMGKVTDWNFLDGDLLANFKSVLTDKVFILSLKNTLFLWVVNFIPQISLALLLTAWFTTRRNQLRGQGLFKVVFYMPNIITAASIAILFKALFGFPIGPVNSLLQNAGIISEPFNFMNKTLPSQLIVSFIQFWMWYGYTMIILVSGVLGISPELYEAAELDGANNVQMFFRVTLPNLKTILLYTLITSMIGGLNMYDIPKLFNNGGPANSTTTANVFIYNQAFSGRYRYNRAAAASMIMFVIIAICSAFVFRMFQDKDEVKSKKASRALKKAQRKSKQEVA